MRPQESATSTKNECASITEEKGKRGHRQQGAKPFSIRLSEGERAMLAREAGKLSLAAHIRRKLLGDALPSERTRGNSLKRPIPKADHAALAKVLALLGRSELARSLDALARAAVMGALPVSPQLTQELHAACAHIRIMRDTLMEAIGVKRDFEHDSGR